MNRTRTLLLIAWGLLALGTVFQIAWPDGGSDIGDDELGAASSEAETGSEEPSAATEHGLAYREAASGAADPGRGSESRTGQVLVDDPAARPEAGVVLPKESLVATVTGSGVAAMAEPAAGPVQHWFPNPTQFGGERAFLVTDETSSVDWVKVSLPVKPNGQEGWIPRSEIEISTVSHRALVDLSDDSVTVWDGDEVVVSTAAVTGKPSTPTPLGVFYVRDIISQSDPDGSYGPYILALSGFSEVLDTFDGALPALAIHGTDNPDQIGTERSSGCVRIPNELITLLAESVPLGTPVTVAV